MHGYKWPINWTRTRTAPAEKMLAIASLCRMVETCQFLTRLDVRGADLGGAGTATSIYIQQHLSIMQLVLDMAYCLMLY